MRLNSVCLQLPVLRIRTHSNSMTFTKEGPHQGQRIVSSGAPLANAKAVLIMVHGRGASAESILELGAVLGNDEWAFLAPQASGYTWYPHSFLAPLSSNEPGLSSGLMVIDSLVKHVEQEGIAKEKIVLGGFSQGACLSSEYVARNPKRYGGLLVFSGGVIGPLGMERSDIGSLEDMPIFIGCSDKDFHIPLERVEETASIFEAMDGNVNKKIYPNMGHTIINDEIDEARKIIELVIAE